MVKKYIYLGPENADTPAAPPRRNGAPIAIMFYYLDRDFREYREIACAPAPKGGRAGARGSK